MWNETVPFISTRRTEQRQKIDLGPINVKPTAERLAGHGYLALLKNLSVTSQISSSGN